MLRDFLEKMGTLCTEDRLLGKRIGCSATLDFDHELKHPESIFAYKPSDKANFRARMAHIFAFKHLETVDTRKAQRCEDLVNLLALNHYKNKYQTEDYDQEISTMTLAIESDPIPEVDSQLTLSVVARGSWGN